MRCLDYISNHCTDQLMTHTFLPLTRRKKRGDPKKRYEILNLQHVLCSSEIDSCRRIQMKKLPFGIRERQHQARKWDDVWGSSEGLSPRKPEFTSCLKPTVTSRNLNLATLFLRLNWIKRHQSFVPKRNQSNVGPFASGQDGRGLGHQRSPCVSGKAKHVGGQQQKGTLRIWRDWILTFSRHCKYIHF